ncbi:hypothetical protein D3C85_379630 [compost metagenome]
MKRVCSDAMYEAFKAVMRGPTADSETYADLTKNAIEAAMAAEEPEETLPILGYLPGGKRIHPIQPGMIATACIVSCVGCHKVIRGMGGPMRGALCLDCWEAAGL